MSFNIHDIEVVRNATLYMTIQNPTLQLFTLNHISFEPDFMIVKQIAYQPVLGDTANTYEIVSSLINEDKNILGSFSAVPSATAGLFVSNPETIFMMRKPINNNSWSLQVLEGSAGTLNAPLVDSGAHLTGFLSIELEFVRLKVKDHQKVY